MKTVHTRSKILEANTLPSQEGEGISTFVAGKADVIDDHHEICAVIFGLRLGIKGLGNNGNRVIEIQLADEAISELPIDRLGDLMEARAEKECFADHEDFSITFFTGTTKKEVAKVLGVLPQEVREHQLLEELPEVKFDLNPTVECWGDLLYPAKIQPGAITKIISQKRVREAVIDFIQSRNEAQETDD